LTPEPGSRESPVALDRRVRDLQRRCYFGDREPAEEAELDNLGLPGVRLRQAFERLVEGDHVQVLLIETGERLVQRYADAVALALPGPSAPGMIDQHLAHGLGGSGKEVAAVGNVSQGFAAEQPEEGLVDQCARLEGVAGSLVTHQTTCDPP
jgi:hypothetical protein